MNDYKFTISAKDMTKKAFRSIKKGLSGVRAGINSTHLQVGVLAGVSGMGLLVKSSLSYADNLGKMSDRLNVATEDLAAFHHLTELNGESTESFDRAVEKMVRGIGEAERGFGPTLKGLQELNINLKDIQGKTAGEQFLAIADGIKGLETQTKKASVAADIFGRKGVRLLTTLNQGKAGFDAARKEVDEYGLSMSRIDAAKAEAANDALLRSQQAVKGLGIKISTQLAPFITAATKHFTKMAVKGTEGTDWITKGIDGVNSVIGVMADGVHGVQIIFQGAKIAGVGFGTAVVGAVKLVIDGIVFLSNSLKDLIFGPIGALIETGNSLGVISDSVLQGFREIDEGLTFETPQIITDSYTSMVTTLGEENAKLHTMMMEPLPSEGITNTFEVIKAEAIATGKIINENIGANGGEGDDAEGEKHREKLQAKLERIAEANLLELELLNQKEAEELAIIQSNLDAKNINYQQFLEQKYKTEARYEKNREKLRKNTGKNEEQAMANLANSVATYGKKGEKISRAIKLRETITNTHAGAMGAYEALAGIPYIGPALGAAAYATVWAQGIKSQQGIKSGSKSGGSAPSVSPPPAQKSFERQPVNLDQGSQSEEQRVTRIENTYIFNNARGNDGQKLVEEAAAAIDNGAVLINPGTRQAQELQEGAA